MKRTYIITLLLSLCSLFTYAQDSFFDKFADSGRGNLCLYLKSHAQPDAQHENGRGKYRRSSLQTG